MIAARKIFILIFVSAMVGCIQSRERVQLDVERLITDTTSVYVLYFRINRRCETCEAVGSVARKVVETTFANSKNVYFVEIDNSVRANRPLLERFDVAWNALIIRRGDEFVDVTQRAFLNVLRNPQLVEMVLVEEIMKKLEGE